MSTAALASFYQPQGALAPVASWKTLPPLGNLEAYITAAQQMPMLTQEQEAEYARQWHDQDDREAAQKLVLSHLRLVISIARQYLGYGLPHADLIQEGNIGLMKAVKRFDPAQGVRLFTYAIYWIKSEIHEYIIRNWRMVKIATTKAQRKIFFNLRSLKAQLQAQHQEDHTAAYGVDEIAQTLNVKPEEVIEMQTRMSGADITIDPGVDQDETSSPVATLIDLRYEPSRLVEHEQHEGKRHKAMEHALSQLDERTRYIVQSRWLCQEEQEPATLHALAAELNISAERVRQIEANALKKMRRLIENSMLHS